MGIVVASIALFFAFVSFISVLGIMREIMTLREDLNAAPALEPSYLGSALPSNVTSILKDLDPTLAKQDFIILFLSSACSTCRHIANSLFETAEQGLLNHYTGRIVAALVDDTSTSIEEDLRSMAVPVIRGEAFFRSTEVRATPAALLITSPGFTASEYQDGVRLEWLMSRITSKDNNLDPAPDA